MKLVVILVLQLLLLASCSTVKYRSSGRIPINILKDDVNRDSKIVTVEGVVHSYLWGMVPGESVVNIDEVVLGSEVTYLEAVQVHEYRSFGNLFLSWITLGMYVPFNYKVTAVGDLKDHRWNGWK